MSAAAGAAAAAVAAMNAINASGGLVRVQPEDFVAIVKRTEYPLVVYCHSKNWLTGTDSYQYITNYKGLSFVTLAFIELRLPEGAELIKANSVYLPV